jgi:hypothetical protein
MSHPSYHYPDWQNLHWGSFTNQFKDFIRKHPEAKVEDLEDFAAYIGKNPAEFNPTTKKRAAFYTNLILPKKKADSDSEGSSSDSGEEGGALLHPVNHTRSMKKAFGGKREKEVPTHPLDHLTFRSA